MHAQYYMIFIIKCDIFFKGQMFVAWISILVLIVHVVTVTDWEKLIIRWKFCIPAFSTTKSAIFTRGKKYTLNI